MPHFLCAISDPDTLANVALSCRPLYAAFKSQEQIIIRQVLINHIGIDVLPEAALTHLCHPPYLRSLGGGLPTETENGELQKYITNFLDNLERPMVAELRFSMDEALDLARTHAYVIAFTERFIQVCSATTSVELQQSFDLHPPSLAELTRISRTLYIFNLFCKLFGCLDTRYESLHEPFYGLGISFLSRFACWELVQIESIYDFLAREVIPGTR